MVTTKTGAQYIAETLQAYDVEYVFVVPAILRRTMVELETLGIKRILAHCEKAAAYMADGYARVLHKPGIVMAQSVGAANLSAGLQDSFLGHSPIVAITGRKPPEFQYRNAYQEILHTSMFDPVTKYNANIDVVEQLPHILGQAFREATTGSPGPVHLDLLGFAGERIESSEISLEVNSAKQYSCAPAWRIEPATNEVEKAVQIIAASQKPVIVVGGGAIISSAESEIVQLAETLLIPVASSCTGKAVIQDDHILNVGIVGSYSMMCANRVVSEADLVIYIGSSVGDQVTNNWTIPHAKTQIIQIDIEPSELGRNYPNTFGILGDAKTTVARILSSVDRANNKKAWAEYARNIVKKWFRSVAPLLNSTDIPMRPERLCQELSNAIPENAIIVSDTGYSTIWTSTMLRLVHPGQKYIRAAGSLGWAFPASLGAKCAAPDRPVICFTGDGGMLYHLSELETAKRRDIPSITIVNNNSGFGQSQIGIRNAYHDSPGNPEEIYRFHHTDFAQIARDFGCFGVKIENPDEIPKAVEKAIRSDIPAVLDVVTNINCSAPDIWEPAQ